MARKKVSNAAALRESFDKNGIDATIDIHQEFLLTQYRIDMSRQQISQYRSAEKRKAAAAAGATASPEPEEQPHAATRQPAAPKASKAAKTPKPPKVVVLSKHGVGDSVAGLIAAVRAAQGSLGNESTTQILSALMGDK